jgi:hypothetical protein
VRVNANEEQDPAPAAPSPEEERRVRQMERKRAEEERKRLDAANKRRQEDERKRRDAAQADRERERREKAERQARLKILEEVLENVRWPIHQLDLQALVLRLAEEFDVREFWEELHPELKQAGPNEWAARIGKLSPDDLARMLIATLLYDEVEARSPGIPAPLAAAGTRYRATSRPAQKSMKTPGSKRRSNGKSEQVGDRCRVCGCYAGHPCVDDGSGKPCHFVHPTLCSGCE